MLTLNALLDRLPVVSFDIAGMYARKPTVFQVNNLSRFPIYEVDFDSGKPVLAIPPDLPNPILIWPAPPWKGGIEVYFSGVLAHVARKLKGRENRLQKNRSIPSITPHSAIDFWVCERGLWVSQVIMAFLVYIV